MANIKDRWSQRWQSHIVEKFVPTSYWTEDSQGNYVLDIDLPGFKHEEVRIEQASADHIQVEGEKITNDNKCIYIDQTFRLPENSDIENIFGRFEGRHLYITVPKMNIGKIVDQNSQVDEHEDEGDYKEDQTKSEPENQTCRVASSPGEIIKKPERKDGPLAIVITCVKQNKGIVLSVVVSFSIGVWVSKHWM